MAKNTLPATVAASKPAAQKKPPPSPMRLLTAVDTGAVIQLYAEVSAASKTSSVTVSELIITAERAFLSKKWPAYFTAAFEIYSWKDVVAAILVSLTFLVNEGWFTYEGEHYYDVVYDRDGNYVIQGVLIATPNLQLILEQVNETKTARV